MWKNTYKDYKPDSAWTKERVEAGKGIVGCEMQELNGWGHPFQMQQPQKKGFLRTLLIFLFKNSRN
jgi:hypothetical protein